MKIFIGTPTYDHKLCCEYVQSVLQTIFVLKEAGIETELRFIGGDCFIDHARNQIVDLFLKSDCTDLLMIDADQGWNAPDVLSMLNRPEPIVAGVVVGREGVDKYHCNPEIDSNGNAFIVEGLMSVEMVGTAFMRVKRSVLTRMVDAYPELSYEEGGNTVPALFQTRAVSGGYVGEDVFFCKLWRDLGCMLWVIPDMTFQHVGRNRWTGNYAEFLQKNHLN